MASISVRLDNGLRVNIGKNGVTTTMKIGNTTISSTGRISTNLGNGVRVSMNTKKKPKKGGKGGGC